MIMEYEMKLNILARFFYYIEQAKDIPLITPVMMNKAYVILSLIDTLMKIKQMNLYKH